MKDERVCQGRIAFALDRGPIRIQEFVLGPYRTLRFGKLTLQKDLKKTPFPLVVIAVTCQNNLRRLVAQSLV